ncbi:hypothetical protein [Nocardia sp. NPDC004604]|uniref:hypothetical protein n=1 Tax=Nocardia sp. NPDC004604 TaxID=3157013 RepID=UPI00339DEF21
MVACTVEIARIDVRRFRDALVADQQVREHLVGRSVTESGTLIVVADIDLPQRFVALSGTWNAASFQYGDREFVG